MKCPIAKGERKGISSVENLVNDMLNRPLLHYL